MRYPTPEPPLQFRCATSACAIALSGAAFPAPMPCPVCHQPLSSGHAERAERNALVDALPTLLALPLAELLQEPNPVLALWAACDLVEIALKLCVMTGLAEHPKPPEELLRQLRDKVELPTLGKWMGMARAVAKHRPQSAVAAFGVPLSETIAALERLLGPSGAPADVGLLPLRNRLAHGGPMGRREADALLHVWKPKVVALAEGALHWLCEARLIAVAATGARVVLQGEHVQETVEGAAIPEDAPVGSAWLRVGTGTLHLGPLGAFDPERAAFELYVRRGEVRLQYLRMGEDGGLSDSPPEAMEAFRSLFAPPLATPDTRQVIRGFEREIREEAARRIGREAELATLIDTVSRQRSGHLWMGGPAGMGKSNLMASLCEHMLDEAERGDLPDTLVLPYRFRAGDDRRGRAPFLTYLRERLVGTPWVQAPAEPEDSKKAKKPGKADSQSTKAADPVTEVRTLLASLRDGARVLLLLDGLDEAVEVDPRFMDDVVFRIVNERVSVVGAGRPERGIPEDFRAHGAADPFPNGLPPMSENDVRALLLERIGPVRKRLLGRDQEKGGAMHNAFIAAVAKRSDGLPIYINYVVGDLNAGKLSVDAVDALPAGLHQYHDELLRRAAVGDLQAVATPTLVLLSLAHEPLTVLEIATLLRMRGVLDTVDVALVERAIAALAAMVRRAPDPDGEEGYALFHHSLRTHMLGAPELRQTVAVTRSALADLARNPERDDAVAVYLYRCGVRHLLDADRGADALALLTDFARTMSRLQRLAGTRRAVDEWYADWERARRGAQVAGDLGLWWDFARERKHFLRRADAEWNADRILLQLAVEHADDSPVTKAAEAYLESGACDWLWLKQVAGQRPKTVRRSGLIAVLEGHEGSVTGAIELADGRLLSWSIDGTLRLWNGATGAQISEWLAHAGGVNGAIALPDGGLLSWGRDFQMSLWDSSGSPRVRFKGHTRSVIGAFALADGRFVSWALDKTIRIWDGDGKESLALRDHTDQIGGVIALPQGRLLSWSADQTLRLWHGTGAIMAVMHGHTHRVRGATALPDGRLLSWSDDQTLRLWDSDGAPIAVLEGHSAPLVGATSLRDGRVLSWSDDHTVMLWESNGTKIVTLTGHTASVRGAAALSANAVVSWSEDANLHLWDAAAGTSIVVLTGHTDSVQGSLVVPDGRVLSWSWDNTLRLWEPSNGDVLAVYADHSDWVVGAVVLANGHLLSWSRDHTLRIWDGLNGASADETAFHPQRVVDTALLAGNRMLSWSEDGTHHFWDIASGTLTGTIVHAAYSVDDETFQTERRAKSTAPTISAQDVEAASLLSAKRQAIESTTILDSASAYAERGGAIMQIGAVPVFWHADGVWIADHLLSDGTIVVRSDSHLAILHLHHGNRRVDIEEAERLLSAEPDRMFGLTNSTV